MDILMKNYIDLGFTKIYFYSIMILIGMAIGVFLVYREFKRHGYNVKELDNMAFYTILCGLVGARIWYVLFNLSEYIVSFLKELLSNIVSLLFISLLLFLNIIKLEYLF